MLNIGRMYNFMESEICVHCMEGLRGEGDFFKPGRTDQDLASSVCVL